MTFEHRHENKSCSACRDTVNKRVKVVKVAKVVKVKVFQVFQKIPGSQLLSDIQTFFFIKLIHVWFITALLFTRCCFTIHREVCIMFKSLRSFGHEW